MPPEALHPPLCVMFRFYWLLLPLSLVVALACTLKNVNSQSPLRCVLRAAIAMPEQGDVPVQG